MISPSCLVSLLLLGTSPGLSTLELERLEKVELEVEVERLEKVFSESSPLNEGETERVRESLCGEHSVVVNTIVGRPLILFQANTLLHFETTASS